LGLPFGFLPWTARVDLADRSEAAAPLKSAGPYCSALVPLTSRFRPSPVTNYLNCSLRYKFQYVENRPPERVSIALPFGGAIHAAVEMFFRAMKNTGRVEPVEALHQRFEDCLALDLENATTPVSFKKDMPDREAATAMGRAMLNAFHGSLNLKGLTIVDVELPLSATLYTEEGTATDFKLYGVIDLLLRGSDGELLVVDYKTAAREMSQATAGDDGQMSAYAYLIWPRDTPIRNRRSAVGSMSCAS
jgi:putative RecB family exonuclease